MTTNPLSRRALIAGAPAAALVASAPALAGPTPYVCGVSATSSDLRSPPSSAELSPNPDSAPALAGTDPIPDAALRALVRAHAEGQARFDALYNRYNDAWDRYLAEQPAPPEVLFPRAEDWGFFPDPAGLHKDRRAFYRPEQMSAIQDDFSGRFVSADRRIRDRVQARRQEILIAGAEYEAALAAVAASTGLPDAEAEYRAEVPRMEALRCQLIEARPETLEGALLKLQVTAIQFDDLSDFEGWIADEFNQGGTAEAIAVSVLRDIMRLAGYLKA